MEFSKASEHEECGLHLADTVYASSKVENVVIGSEKYHSMKNFKKIVEKKAGKIF